MKTRCIRALLGSSLALACVAVQPPAWPTIGVGTAAAIDAVKIDFEADELGTVLRTIATGRPSNDDADTDARFRALVRSYGIDVSQEPTSPPSADDKKATQKEVGRSCSGARIVRKIKIPETARKAPSGAVIWHALPPKLARGIVNNRDFLASLHGHERDRIYDVNPELGNRRIGVIFLTPEGMDETVVFGRAAGVPIYKKIGIAPKAMRRAMLKSSVPMSCVRRLALLTHPGSTD